MPRPLPAPPRGEAQQGDDADRDGESGLRAIRKPERLVQRRIDVVRRIDRQIRVGERAHQRQGVFAVMLQRREAEIRDGVAARVVVIALAGEREVDPGFSGMIRNRQISVVGQPFEQFLGEGRCDRESGRLAKRIEHGAAALARCATAAKDLAIPSLRY